MDPFDFEDACNDVIQSYELVEINGCVIYTIFDPKESMYISRI